MVGVFEDTAASHGSGSDYAGKKLARRRH